MRVISGLDGRGDQRQRNLSPIAPVWVTFAETVHREFLFAAGDYELVILRLPRSGQAVGHDLCEGDWNTENRQSKE